MSEASSNSFRYIAPWIVIAATFALMVFALQEIGRPWTHESGIIYLWVGDAWSDHNSKHLFDPYSFSHLEHGILFAALAYALFRAFVWPWRLAFTLIAEAAWEVFENSPTIIAYYQAYTASTSYTGDTIINSIGDILATIVGFFIFHFFGWKWSVIAFLTIEILMIATIRDSLILHMIMFLTPIQDIADWQMGV